MFVLQSTSSQVEKKPWWRMVRLVVVVKEFSSVFFVKGKIFLFPLSENISYVYLTHQIHHTHIVIPTETLRLAFQYSQRKSKQENTFLSPSCVCSSGGQQFCEWSFVLFSSSSQQLLLIIPKKDSRLNWILPLSFCGLQWLTAKFRFAISEKSKLLASVLRWLHYPHFFLNLLVCVQDFSVELWWRSAAEGTCQLFQVCWCPLMVSSFQIYYIWG